MNRIFSFFLLLAFSTCLSAQTITDSLVFYYPFSTNFNDASINGLNPTNNGSSFVHDRFGWERHAVYFDGVNDYIQLPNHPMMFPSLPISLSFWVKTENLLPNDNRFFTLDDDFGNYSGVRVHTTNNGQIFLTFGSNLGSTGGNFRRAKQSQNAITAGNWHHIVCIVRSALDMSIYIDCVDAGGTYKGTGQLNMAWSGNAGKIGMDSGNSNLGPIRNWGAFDDFAMWSRELSINEIYSLCNGNPLSIDDEKPIIKNNVEVYPNPSIDQLNVRLDFNEFSNHHFVIYDLNGRIIHSEKIDSSSLIISRGNWEAGLYFYSIIDNTARKIYAGKVVFH